MATSESKKKIKINANDCFNYSSMILIKVSNIESVFTESDTIIIQQWAKGENSVFYQFRFNAELSFVLFRAFADIANKINDVRKKPFDDYLLILKPKSGVTDYKDIYLLSEVELIY